MKLPLSIFFFLPHVNAWTFLYTNTTDNATILHEKGTLGCTRVDLAGGKEFSWDPESSSFCISIYYDDSCTSRGGISCPTWKKNASTHFGSIEISTDDEASTASVSIVTLAPISTSTATSSTASTPTTTTTSTTADSPATAKSSSRPSLSGGAIAGIVIGAIAGVLIIAALCFFLSRRRRKNAAVITQQANSVPEGPYTPQTATPGTPATSGPSSMGILEKPPSSSITPAAYRPAAGSRVVDLSGPERPSELGDNSISELDGRAGGR
ncbi:uncharacterized protein N7459_006956 [Penicillium hispanicum]|uniref:uncharacterized protein n=1 Tax=Penicillium hispanicum TaxID=1080232 RepID=UPI002540054D|nr:uncharacterized protein N7459_006956 [Penicillium hispanicum]KAJ5577992.1 hypothetical protein N7459_006956 [Penicillium hispanicum]